MFFIKKGNLKIFKNEIRGLKTSQLKKEKLKWEQFQTN